MKAVLQAAAGAALSVELDWTESIVHPDARVEWGAWLSTNDGGQACSAQKAFLQSFRDTAESLEKVGGRAGGRGEGQPGSLAPTGCPPGPHGRPGVGRRAGVLAPTGCR